MITVKTRSEGDDETRNMETGIATKPLINIVQRPVDLVKLKGMRHQMAQKYF